MRTLLRLIPLAVILVVACRYGPTPPDPIQDQEIAVGPGKYHLGDDVEEKWVGHEDPLGARLDLEFQARAREQECCLVLTQEHVNGHWAMLLNGQEFSVLRRHGPSRAFWHEVPGGLLRDGANTLSLVPADPADDILVSAVTLVSKSLRETLALGAVEVSVRDADVGDPLPARITITAPDGHLPEVLYATSTLTAVRDGIAYTANGKVHLELPEGTYTVTATRGTEWSWDKRSIRVSAGQNQRLSLELRREVDTTGYVSSDTHIHTLTFSGHGDASVEERLVTLAGEGVELAIATDHNHNTDYRPLQQQLALNQWFTTVTGNEVTTRNGHFNAFPLDPTDEVPDVEEPDWVELIKGIRSKGAGVVILNHPRWPDNDSPFDRFGMTHRSGDRTDGPVRFTFDGLELINSDSLLDDPFALLWDWFGVLNSGNKVTAVGSSDSHTVGVIVGQGRTYVQSSTDDPAALDMSEIVRSFRAGRTSVSLGIVAETTVNETAGMGDVLRNPGASVRVRLRVAAPSWVRPRTAHVFVNGREVAQAAVPMRDGVPTEADLFFDVAMPPHDAYLVCVVLGDGIQDPAWRTMKDYTFAATNPVYLDGNQDELWSSPLDVANGMFDDQGNLDQQQAVACDSTVAIQLARVLMGRTGAAPKMALVRALLSLRPEDEELHAYLTSNSGGP